MNEMLIKTVDDWKKLAREIAPSLTSGTVLALSGHLGAGKTTFVQALAEILGAKGSPRSPTFSLVRTYKLKTANDKLTRLVHVDAYRIERAEDLLPLNLDEELAEPGTILVLEWPENAVSWIKKQLSMFTIKIELGENEERTVRLLP